MLDEICEALKLPLLLLVQLLQVALFHLCDLCDLLNLGYPLIPVVQGIPEVQVVLVDPEKSNKGISSGMIVIHRDHQFISIIMESSHPLNR